MTKYALLKYGPPNLGDEIQSLAAGRFLPRVDHYIDRDKIAKFRARHKVKVILNGWFMNAPANWPPPRNIDPLFISFHIAEMGNIVNAMLKPKNLRYFKKHEPIGCRDLHTLNLLTSQGIKAYFSGCLTLTLNRPEGLRDNGLIVFADPFGSNVNHDYFAPGEFGFRQDLWEKIPKAVREKAVFTTHSCGTKDSAARFGKAARLLRLYAGAKLVITSRLHAALPCLAFGTPVVYVDSGVLVARSGGLKELLRSCSIEDIKNSKLPVNWKCPEPNPVDITAMRDKLIIKCSDFVRATPEIR